MGILNTKFRVVITFRVTRRERRKWNQAVVLRASSASVLMYHLKNKYGFV